MIDKQKGRGMELLLNYFKKIIAANPKLTKIVTASVCVTVCGIVVVGFSIPKSVTVMVDDSLTTNATVYETTCKRVNAFLETHNIDFNQDEDIIDVDLDDTIEDGMTINVSKAFDVKVSADGRDYEIRTLSATVRDVLTELEIKFNEDDIVEPALDENLCQGDDVILKRVTKEYITEEEEMDFDVVYKADNSIAIGDTKVTQKGRKGLERKTYEVTYVDGKKKERVLEKSEVITQVQDKVISYGTKIKFSKPDGLKYERKINNVKAVSYYYSGNPHGAYGLKCEYGTVAVDKKLIPLGSLLYIEGYGYAIANDVGSGIKGKMVDLYMEKFEQCLLWGAQWTTVYVIDEA